MLQHLFRMEIGDQKRDIITLSPNEPLNVRQNTTLPKSKVFEQTHLNSLPSEYKKGLRPLCQESGKLMYQNMLYLVRLLDLDANPNAIYAGFNKDLLVLVPRYCQWVQQDLWRAGGFNLGDIVSF